MPYPLSRSTPGSMMSIAVLVRMLEICVAVSEGFAPLTSAAIAATWGAAAEVP